MLFMEESLFAMEICNRLGIDLKQKIDYIIDNELVVKKYIK